MIRLAWMVVALLSGSVASAGILVVETTPVFPVPIFIDGKEQGTAPATWTNCTRGNHLVTIKHPDFRAKSQRVACGAGLTKVNLALTDLRWLLRVDSSPTRLQVLIDGKRICRTPCVHNGNARARFNLTVQARKKTLRQRGISWSQKIKMRSSSEKAVRAEIAHGFLKLTDPLSHGVIEVGGIGKLGSGPMLLASGNYTLTTSGFGETVTPSWRQQTIEIPSDGSTVEAPQLTFVTAPARISVLSVPTGARVAIDGEEAGTTPLEGHELAAGRYSVRVKKKGFRPVTFSAELGPGDAMAGKPIKLRAYTVVDRVPGGIATTAISGVLLAAGMGLVYRAGTLRGEYVGLWEAGSDVQRQRQLQADHQATYPMALSALGLGLAGSGFVAYQLVRGGDPE